MYMPRLNLNKGAYKGELTDIDSILANCTRLAQQNGWEIEKIVAAPDIELLVLKKIVSQTAKNFYISSGIHGDEPAGPRAVERLLEKNQWPADANIYLLPCVNPTGARLHTRENKDKVDLNRDYLDPKTAETIAHTKWLDLQPDFFRSMNVHEDWEANCFYIYGSNKDNAHKVVEAVRKVFPIETGPEADGMPVINGVMDVKFDGAKLPFWPEAFYLYLKKKSENYTLEASSDYPMEERVNALVTGVETLLHI